MSGVRATHSRRTAVSQGCSEYEQDLMFLNELHLAASNEKRGHFSELASGYREGELIIPQDRSDSRNKKFSFGL